MTKHEQEIYDLQNKLEAAYDEISYWKARANCAELAMFDLIDRYETKKSR